jgi:superfamily I DNA and/or RNA helicase
MRGDCICIFIVFIIELKELEQMLDEDQNSEEDADYIAAAIQRFRKSENTANVNLFPVVGTTLASSVFDIFTNMKFPLCLVDEASQIMEPLSMVPIVRFMSSRLIMIGDPLQVK